MEIVSARMNNLKLFVLLVSHACFGTIAATCSWGTWSHWDCTCCGKSVNKPVYRVRTQCCPETYACGNLRDMAKPITFIGTDFREKGECLNDCSNTDFTKPRSTCSSVVPTMIQTLLLATRNLCRSVCIGSLSTTVSSVYKPSKTAAIHRTSTRVNSADVKSSTYVPSYSSNDTAQSRNNTQRPGSGSDRSLEVSSRQVLWIPVVLCLLDLVPTLDDALLLLFISILLIKLCRLLNSYDCYGVL